MKLSASFGLFLSVCFLLTVSPGADTALVLKNTLRKGHRIALLTTLGICAGLLFHAVMTSVGLSLVFQKIPSLFMTLQWLGALYLIYLGFMTIRESFLASPKTYLETDQKVESRESKFAAFRQGALSNILNPKAAVFYLTFLPQFTDRAGNLLLQSLALASIHIVMSLLWLSLIIKFVTSFQDFLGRPRVRAFLESISGLALLGFGLKLAWGA